MQEHFVCHGDMARGVGKRDRDSTKPSRKLIIPVIMAVRVYCPREWFHGWYAMVTSRAPHGPALSIINHTRR